MAIIDSKEYYDQLLAMVLSENYKYSTELIIKMIKNNYKKETLINKVLVEYSTHSDLEDNIYCFLGVANKTLSKEFLSALNELLSHDKREIRTKTSNTLKRYAL